MQHLTTNDGLAIWELIYYIIGFSGSIFVSARHGLLKSSGWIFLTMFCVIRLISCSAQLATITAMTDRAAVTAGITWLLGLSPLLLATLGILSRVYYSILHTPWKFLFSMAVVKMVQLPAAIALILCIVGGTSASGAEDIGKEDTIKAGLILYLVVFLLISLLTVGAVIGRGVTGRGEDRLLCAVALTLPAIAIRIAYSFISTFSGNPSFSTSNRTTKSTLIQLFMVRIEEMYVLLIYLWVGILQPSVAPNDDGKERTKSQRLGYRVKRGDFRFGKLGMVSLVAHFAMELFSTTNNGKNHVEVRSEGEEA